MRIPRPRVTVRGLMVLVAVVGVVIGVTIVRRNRFRELAAHHRSLAWTNTVPLSDASGHEYGRKFVATPHASWRWHFALSNKYADAARRPWLPVAPDSPEPR